MDILVVLGTYMADKEIFKNGVRDLNCSLFNCVLHLICSILTVVTIWLKELRRINKKCKVGEGGGYY